MRLTTTFATIAFTFTVGIAQALAQNRYDVGLLLGATKTSDEGQGLEFDRGTTPPLSAARGLPGTASPKGTRAICSGISGDCPRRPLLKRP